jgi:hypothetical protein
MQKGVKRSLKTVAKCEISKKKECGEADTGRGNRKHGTLETCWCVVLVRFVIV